MYDAVFVGAGIVSLVAAYKHKKNNPGKDHVLLEASGRPGGRAMSKVFCGREVPLGAGVGRVNKDKEFLQLLQELSIPYTKHPKRVGYLGVRGSSFVKRCLKKIADDYRPGETFRGCGTRVLGQKAYDDFVDSAGYTDYESSGVKDVLDNYGFDDLSSGGSNFFFSWNTLVKRLSKGLNIVYSARVTKIDGRTVHAGNKTYEGKDIFVGVTANSLRTLFPGHFQGLHSQPFLRVYGLLNKELPISGYTVVGRPLQKVIPIGDRVYMVSYTDNECALLLKNKGKKAIERMLQEAFDDPDIRIQRMLRHFWKEGTHYWEPNADRKMPKGIHFIGEAVNDEQGWTGPAIRELGRVITDGKAL